MPRSTRLVLREQLHSRRHRGPGASALHAGHHLAGRQRLPAREDHGVSHMGFDVSRRGDTYASFGRGIALNLVKNTNIDIDTSLRGAKVGGLQATSSSRSSVG